jgi:hypothetical protein
MLAIEEAVMPASSVRPRWIPALAVGALSAALTFFLVRPTAPEADGGAELPSTVAGDVRLYGELKETRGRWAVLVRAVNGAAAPRRCKVTATVSELRDSPMSRVVRAPRTLWTAELALAVGAQGAAEQRVAVPADVAAQLGSAVPVPATRANAAKPRKAAALPTLRETISHSVWLQASCPGDEVVG